MVNVKKPVNRDHLKVIYAAIQEQVNKLPAIMNIFTGQESHRWYECGEVYQSRSHEAICRKYVGHPGKHAMRRRNTEPRWYHCGRKWLVLGDLVSCKEYLGHPASCIVNFAGILWAVLERDGECQLINPKLGSIGPKAICTDTWHVGDA